MQKMHLHGVLRMRCVQSCGQLALEAAPRPHHSQMRMVRTVQLRWPAGPPRADNALPGTVKTTAYKNLQSDAYQNELAVGNQALHVARVGFIYLRHFFQATHAVRSLGAQKMALAGMSAQNFAAFGDLKTLGGSAMSL
jgi:hypothetical protein